MEILIKIWDEEGKLVCEELCENFVETQEILKREFESEDISGKKYNQIPGRKFELTVATSRQIKIHRNKNRNCWNESIRDLKKMEQAY